MMKKNTLKNIAGLTLIEILIGVIISSIMMAAMYTTYSVVNNSYSQVIDRAKISRSGRDIVEMIMRDVRMAGFKYILGTNTFTIGGNPVQYPTRSYLEFIGINTSLSDSHDPIIIITNQLGYTRTAAGAEAPPTVAKHDSKDLCCDKIHIVYDDFNQNDVTQPYKRYKITYFALPIDEGGDQRYAAYKTVESWVQVLGDETGEWVNDCTECYVGQKIRDHLVDMEFIAFNEKGIPIIPPPRPDADSRNNLYNIRAVDVRLTFRSKKEFYKFVNTRFVKGLSGRSREYTDDKYLRDSVVVTIHTRNIGGGI